MRPDAPRLIEALQDRLGSDVEVFLQNQFYSGTLMQAENGVLTVYSDIGGYDATPVKFVIPLSAVQFVRVLPA
ncbi:hypothetical protein [Gorillibacterium sp. sgz500922]|uniref:hypothetical protein n=1 Tax=Gorillibacterium sp. sgz500922 TaxID=3446694 RepID=UPI003F677BBF